MRGSPALIVLGLGCPACLESADVVASLRADAAAPEDAGPPQSLQLTGDLDVHDPAIIQTGQEFLLYSTGEGIPITVSDDLLSWRSAGAVFDENPAWIAERIPGATNLWSPDVAFFGGEYHLYYAASTFGSNRSCIGHATSSSLSATTVWQDQGPLICSNTTDTPDDWNAIDPTVLVTEDAATWLAFGSYETGIKLLRLDDSGLRADSTFVALASRPDDTVQAAALAQRAGQYYLFISADRCCMGADSTHKIMVGRSASVEGPYLDRDGTPLLEGGGSLLLEGDTRWRGPGSNDIFSAGGRTYNVYRAYDADNGGRPTLRISTLIWDDAGWPVSGGP